jgi:hypothetical protein
MGFALSMSDSWPYLETCSEPPLVPLWNFQITPLGFQNGYYSVRRFAPKMAWCAFDDPSQRQSALCPGCQENPDLIEAMKSLCAID